MEPIRQKLYTLLLRHAHTPYAREHLSRAIVDAAFEMGHLYSDLGLESRIKMNRMMQQHYPVLAARKPEHLRWKKFLFDAIDAVAPACAACGDKQHCFSCELSII